jgi:hypothetical protein
VLAGDEIAARCGGVAVVAVALVEARMEVAVDRVGQRRRFAASTVDLDVTAKWVLRGISLLLLRLGSPGGIWNASAMDAII